MFRKIASTLAIVALVLSIKLISDQQREEKLKRQSNEIEDVFFSVVVYDGSSSVNEGVKVSKNLAKQKVIKKAELAGLKLSEDSEFYFESSYKYKAGKLVITTSAELSKI